MQLDRFLASASVKTLDLAPDLLHPDREEIVFPDRLATNDQQKRPLVFDEFRVNGVRDVLVYSLSGDRAQEPFRIVPAGHRIFTFEERFAQDTHGRTIVFETDDHGAAIGIKEASDSLEHRLFRLFVLSVSLERLFEFDGFGFPAVDEIGYVPNGGRHARLHHLLLEGQQTFRVDSRIDRQAP